MEVFVAEEVCPDFGTEFGGEPEECRSCVICDRVDGLERLCRGSRSEKGFRGRSLKGRGDGVLKFAVGKGSSVFQVNFGSDGFSRANRFTMSPRGQQIIGIQNPPAWLSKSRLAEHISGDAGQGNLETEER